LGKYCILLGVNGTKIWINGFAVTAEVAYTMANAFSNNANVNINNIEIIIIFVIVAVMSINCYGQHLIYSIINIVRIKKVFE
jgi:hypothetical protein